MIHLYLSSPYATNSLYVTAAGRPVFKVETPPVSIGDTRRTIIRRAVDTVDGVWLGDEEKDSDEDRGETIPYIEAQFPSPSSEGPADSPHLSFEGHFAHLAHIEHATLKPSRILYAGREMHTNKLFKPKGWSWCSLTRHVGPQPSPIFRTLIPDNFRNKVFRASDGCEYHWVIGTKCQTVSFQNLLCILRNHL